MVESIGIDFGTTNSVVARCGQDRQVELISIEHAGAPIEVVRSALGFWRESDRSGERINVEIGPFAIDEFLAHPDATRFIQSIKNFAASRIFTGTHIYGKRYQFEDLLAAFMVQLRQRANLEQRHEDAKVVVGRPVAFAGADADEKLAMARYSHAFEKAGFGKVLFVYEPVAAAFYFADQLKERSTVLVADFGGGTTDFSVLEIENANGVLKARPLSRGGVGIAGDSFDYRIIDNAILPFLGKGSAYKSDGKLLDVPRGIFSSFSRWNTLSLLKYSPELRDIRRIIRQSVEPEKLQRIIEIVEGDHALGLYKAVSEAKVNLSEAESTKIIFNPLGESFQRTIEREEFEMWIGDDLERIRIALDKTLNSASISDSDIDKVFLTGGSSFVPAVRRMFTERFGQEKLEMGSELLSIAQGLALIGARDDANDWVSDG